MRWSALRGRALDEAAAALLEYFDAAAAENAPVVHGSTETPADEPMHGVQWLRLGADAPMHSAAAAEEKAAAVGRELLQMTDVGEETLRMLQTAEDAAPEAAGFSAAIHRRDALRGVPEMDDISEFFRRDSRRYDKGFSGGYGL